MKRSAWMFVGLVFAPLCALAQFTIEGVTDKTIYNNSVSLRVVAEPGFEYSVTLNTSSIPAGVFVTLNAPDFYELRAMRTELAGGATTNRYIRFIVNATSRGTTEVGLPPHTPFPVINSAAAEFAGAALRILAPASFPESYPIPVVAWVMNEEGHAVRANAMLTANGAPAFQLRRGVGSGFLNGETVAGTNVTLAVPGLSTNISVVTESNVTWTSVGGVLEGETSWPAHSRIHVTGSLTIPTGSTLTIGEGSILRLNSRADITNNGMVQINGTLANPVVFMPANSAQPWGGFVMRTTSGTVNATGTIFTGAGAEPSWFGRNGNPGSHRVEQALFYCDGGQVLNLTDSASIYMPGQWGHSRSSSVNTFITLNRFLMQRCPTGGEFTGARFVVNDSAFIECPEDSGIYQDGDNDALYIVDGSHFFTNTLFGWVKDDGVDSGGSGYGPLTYESCWFEAAFHEGNSLSGYKDVLARNTVYIDCSQGLENGYNGPTSRVDNCFFTLCKAGVRHGDNYESIGAYAGIMIATNSIALHNHRDLFGFNWRSDGWTNNYGQLLASNNLVTAFDPYFPNNEAWNPVEDGWRLGALGGVGEVGMGFTLRGQPSLAQLAGGLPVGLSRFCTNEVRADYEIESTDGTFLSGTLVFPSGLMRQLISMPTNASGVVRVALRNPTNAEITGPHALYFFPAGGGSSTNVTLIARGAVWRYLDNGTDAGTAWREIAFDDAAWSSGPAQLGYNDGDEATVVSFGPSSNNKYITTYFRRAFTVSNPASYDSLALWLLRDDGGAVYVNGTEVFRSPNMPQPPTPITYLTEANSGGENTIDQATISADVLVPGTNVVAVEIHQDDPDSSDISFDFELVGSLLPGPVKIEMIRFGDELALYWSGSGYTLEEADEVTGPWNPVPDNGGVATVALTGTQKFYRLRR